MTRRDLLAALSAAALAAACRRVREPSPVAIAFGRDECAYCRMTIDDPRLAAEFVEAGGRAHRFGEPGCLVNWIRRENPPPGAAFVTDAARGGWIPATAAAYVTARIRTPMSYDVVAYRSPPPEPGAGEVRDWHALVTGGVPSGPR